MPASFGRVLASLVVIATAACGDFAGSIQNNCDGGFCPPDARRPPDARLTCHDEQGPQCGEGEVCLHAVCVPNTCATASPCAEGDSCNMTCVPLRDLCEGVECQDNKTCVDGECFPGCFPPSPCLSKDCGEGEFCSYGVCKTLVPCSATCGDGFACHVTCTPPNPCDNVDCEENEFCFEGQCIVDPCYDVDCPPTQACNAGVCETTCNCGPAGCGPNGECILDTCECAPDCTGKMCGDDNGCGGECDVTCPGVQEDCRTTAGGGAQLSCVCVPDCAGKACGAANGCGGECSNNTCTAPSTCQDQGGGNYECNCIPSCAGKTCGQLDSCNQNECNGTCSDNPETCTGNPTNYECTCPMGNPTCGNDCCTGTQTVCAGGNTVCCTPANLCRDVTEDGTFVPTDTSDACCGSGTTCLDGGDADAEGDTCCSSAANLCNDGTEDAAFPGADTRGTCCSGVTCLDGGDADALKDTCCSSVAKLCDDGTEDGAFPGTDTNATCCGGSTDCFDGGDADSLKDTCCAPANMCNDSSDDGAFPGNDTNMTCCNQACIDSADAGTEKDVCCPSTQTFCDGKCIDKCAGSAPINCGDGQVDNEICCGAGVDRCLGAANANQTTGCCVVPQELCYDEPDEDPICCSDPESFCKDSGACCTPDAKVCLSDDDGNEMNDLCCDTGQVVFGGVCCTPECPPVGSITCGALDTCGFNECPGQCDANSTCIQVSGGPSNNGVPDDYTCQTLTCNPVCNTGACYQCIGGECDYRCDNPGYGGTICRNGRCQTP